MKKPDPHITTIWILGIIILFIFTEEYYQYRESWNRIRRQGLQPTLMSGDKISNQAISHSMQKIYEKEGIQPSYWYPYMFGGMPTAFFGVQHFLVYYMHGVFGMASSPAWNWCYIIDIIPLVVYVWRIFLHSPVPPTPKELALIRESNKACLRLLYSLAGWLVFYWFYAETRGPV